MLTHARKLGLVFALTVAAQAANAADAVDAFSELLNLKLVGNLSLQDEGQTLRTRGLEFAGYLVTNKPIPVGFHCLEGEYRTLGTGPRGTMATDVKSIDNKTTYSKYERIVSTTEWAKLRIYFKMDAEEKIRTRLIPDAGLNAKTSLELRNLRIVPYAPAPQQNLLENGDFLSGAIGYIPTTWYLPNPRVPEKEIALVEDTTAKSGRAVRFQHDGASFGKDGISGRLLTSVGVPWPGEGTLKFTVRAKALSGTPEMTTRVYGANWSYNQPKQFTLTADWETYTLEVPCPADPGAPWLHTRIETTQPAAFVVTDAVLTWTPKTNAQPAVAPAAPAN